MISVQWRAGTLELLDQRLLPGEEVTLACKTVAAVEDAIKTLAVRGAPAIGIAAAFGMLLEVDSGLPLAKARRQLLDQGQRLRAARPTAVNLAWAIDQMCRLLDEDYPNTSALMARLEAQAMTIRDEDAAACRRIGDHGLPLVTRYPRVLTHCNAGALAVSEYGTALAPIYRAHEQGIPVTVLVDETRPLLQGARLTAYELMKAGVPLTVITDNMAAHMMSQSNVDMVLVGSDRVAANGDVANKIGTLNLAILCQYFDIPFYVACPMSTIDVATPTGVSIEIESRDPREVTHIAGQQMTPASVCAANPAFDVTPAALVSGIITEQGVFAPPFNFSESDVG